MADLPYNAIVEAAQGEETILLVDDQDLIIAVGREMIKAIGYTVLTAKNGCEALELFRQNKGSIRLVILDYVLPGMKSSEIYDRLAAMQPAVKVLISSGYSNHEEVAALLTKGCVGYIQKPFGIQELAQKIREVMNLPAQ